MAQPCHRRCEERVLSWVRTVPDVGLPGSPMGAAPGTVRPPAMSPLSPSAGFLHKGGSSLLCHASWFCACSAAALSSTGASLATPGFLWLALVSVCPRASP